MIVCLFDEDGNVTVKNAWNDQYGCSYDDEESQVCVVHVSSLVSCYLSASELMYISG